MKSLADYQKEIDDMLQAYETPYWEPLSILARLIEEVGEVARILNHQYGDKPKKATEKPQELSEELADVLYSIICLANREGISLEGPLERAIAKLETRDAGRFTKKK
jgi:NTP pyrophosphatase (non-canonical NTP hydrolase)